MALSNLLKNAAHAVRSITHRRPKIGLWVRRERAVVEVVVEDNGDGMTPETVERLKDFPAFFTTKGEHGSGLGAVFDGEDSA